MGRMLAHVKSILIYGESPEMDNALEGLYKNKDTYKPPTTTERIDLTRVRM